mgnify:CR=1 FL=1
MTAGLFTRTYAHWREVCQPDGAGGQTCDWAKLGDIAGRAYPRSQNETVIGARLQGEVIWVFATGPDVDLQVNDQIRFDGRALTVRAHATTSTGRRQEAECEEIQP